MLGFGFKIQGLRLMVPSPSFRASGLGLKLRLKLKTQSQVVVTSPRRPRIVQPAKPRTATVPLISHGTLRGIEELEFLLQDKKNVLGHKSFVA